MYTRRNIVQGRVVLHAIDNTIA